MKTLDKELLEKIREKNVYAFNEFYNRYATLLYKWVYSRIRNDDACNEVTQDFWASFWENPDIIKINEQGSAKNYLLHFFGFGFLYFYAFVKPCTEFVE